MLLALLLILAGLAGAIAPQTAAAQGYGIRIDDKWITPDNYTDISASGGFKAVKSGTVTFDPATYALTLNNATIEANGLGIYIKGRMIEQFHIILVGNNTIISRRHSIETSDKGYGLLISGGGTLTLKPETSDRAIFINTANLRIMDCTINAEGPIYVKNGDLTIMRATVKVDLSHGSSAFIVSGLIKFEGSWITSPSGADIGAFKGNTTVMLDGKPCKQVIIEPGNSPKPPEPGPEAKFTLEPKELKVDAEKHYRGVTLSCNVPYLVNGIDNPDWLSVSGYSAEYDTIQEMTIVVKPNTGSKREGVITFHTTEGNVTLKVTQEGTGTKPEPEPEVKFTLEPKDLKVDSEESFHSVTLSCNVSYYIKDYDKPDWLSVSGHSTGYKKSQTLTLEFKPNTGPERTADVVFKTDKGDVTLKVTQEGTGTKPEPEKAVFTLEPKELKVETGGGKKEVTLSCNQAFELNKVTVPNWMERVPSSATSDEKSRVCAFNIQKNTGPERKGEIVFHTDKGDVTLKVTQAGKKEKPEPEKPEPTLTVSATSVTFPPEGGDPKIIPVKSSHGWSVERDVSKGTGDWITFGEQPEGLYISVEENTGTRQRAVQLFVISDKNLKNGQPLKRTVLVTQQAKKPAEAVSGLSINPAAITMGSGGGMVGFNVYASKGWTISGSPEWMHPDATRGSGTRLVIVRFDRNESGAERTGKLTVKSDDGKTERTFTLTQRASQRKPSRPSDDGTYDYDLALNPEEITVGPSDGAGSTISVATSRLWAGSTTEDWIKLNQAVGRGNGSFTFSLAANPSKEMRHGTITVRTQQGMDELKVAIHQQGNDGSVVPPAEVKVSNVTLDPATLTVNGDLSTALISAIVSPDNARNKGLLWMSSNAAVATVKVTGTSAVAAALSDRPQLRFAPDADDYALVTIVGKGKAVITAAASDGSGIVARCEVNVLSTVANTVPYAPQAKVYTVGPTLYLSLPTPETVQVYTLAGTLYRTWQAPAGDTSVTLPAGTYIIKVGQLTEKVVVR